MGKRARARGAAPPRPSAPAPGRRPGAGLGPVRRALTGYLIGALVLAVVTLAGILVLGGSLGPFVTLAVVVLGAGLVHRAARRRLAGAELSDEDRMIQTMAGGMLAISVLLAAAGAVVSTVA
jgi:hypothetical protein